MPKCKLLILWLSILVVVCLFLSPHPAVALSLLVLGFLIHWFSIFKGLKRHPSDAPLILESISASHFVEKVRWCLDHLGVPYREKAQAGILGVFFKGQTVPRLLIPTGMVYSQIGNSAEILRYLWGRYCAELGPDAEFLKPTPEALQWEKDFDRYGVHLQVWFYSSVLKQPAFTKRLWGQKDPHIPVWQRLAIPILCPLLSLFLKKAFRISRTSRAQAQTQIEALLAKVDIQLKDGRSFILGGDQPSFVDFSFAALSGIWINPPGYGNGRADAVMPGQDLVPEELKEQMALLKERYARSYNLVQRMYQEHRTKTLITVPAP